MCPVMARSLPISLFDSVFATYISVSKQTLPATDEADTALLVARQLCSTMGDHFDSEPAQRSAFLETTRPLFSQWAIIKESMSQGVTAYTGADTTISVNGATMALIEIKNGKTGGKGYMQACRGYDINTEELVEENQTFLKQGAPTFLLCLSGESGLSSNRRWITDLIHADEELRIADAFKDGQQVVVEPLSLLLLYPDSRGDSRTIQLAQHLFALHSCLVTITSKIRRCGILNPSFVVPLF
jgi:hypothetical protein